METGIKVGECMKTSLVTISETASVYDAAKKMRSARVGSLLVEDSQGRIYGIVTDEDIVWKAVAPERMDAQVRELTSKPLVGISVNADISDAADLMGRKNIKRLVVLSDQNAIAGVISERDIVRISPSLYDLICERSARTPVLA